MITAENVSFSYRSGSTSVSDVSFHIAKGDFTAVMGENGAGKSTVLKLIDGLLKPQSGKMTVCGLDTAKSRVSERARHVGYLFQNPDRQICQNTVREEIAFSLKAVGEKDDAAIDARADEILGIFGFSAEAEPFSLSRGQRQQLALASVLAVKPEILILDEPTTGLDYRECCRVMDLIGKMNAEDQTTVVMVCHDMEVVLDYAKRAIVMAGGRIIADGGVRDIFRSSGVMEKASLIPPQIIGLAARLGDGFDSIYDAASMADAVAEMISSGERR